MLLSRELISQSLINHGISTYKLSYTWIFPWSDPSWFTFRNA